LFLINSKPQNIYKYAAKTKVDNGFSAAMLRVVSSLYLRFFANSEASYWATSSCKIPAVDPATNGHWSGRRNGPLTPALEGRGVARHHPPTGRHPNDHARLRLPRPERRSSKGEGARAATRWPAAAPTTSRGRGSPLAAAGAGRAARRHRPAPGHLQPRGMGRRGGAVAKPLRLFILLLPLPVLKSNRSDRIRLAPAPSIQGRSGGAERRHGYRAGVPAPATDHRPRRGDRGQGG